MIICLHGEILIIDDGCAVDQSYLSKLRRSEGFNVFELKGRGGRAGILYLVVVVVVSD